jgi:hypothetical protein
MARSAPRMPGVPMPAPLVPEPPQAPQASIVGRGLAPASRAEPVRTAPLARPPATAAMTRDATAPANAAARGAAERLARLRRSGELRAAILACMLSPGNEREHRAWRLEAAGAANADEILADLALQPRAARVPWFSDWVRLAAGAPLDDRRSLVEAARKVMTAAGVVKPLDRLRWLTLRHMLAASGSKRGLATAPPPDSPQAFYRANLRHIATYTAFLARMIPVYAVDIGIDPLGERWYQAVLQRFIGMSPLPPCRVPDSDSLVHALRALQDLGWMHRPPVIRAWVGEAIGHSPDAQLSPEAADALQMTCLLMDSPMPQELQRFFPDIGSFAPSR